MSALEKQIKVWEKQFGQMPFWLIVGAAVFILLAFNLYLNCRLTKRAGYSSMWGIVLSMPWISELGCLWMAFRRWPSQKG